MTNSDRVPGTWLRRFAERTFDRETLDRVILPALDDVQHECTTAPGPTLAERFVRVRTYWGFWKAIGLCLLTDAGHKARPTVEGVTVAHDDHAPHRGGCRHDTHGELGARQI